MCVERSRAKIAAVDYQRVSYISDSVDTVQCELPIIELQPYRDYAIFDISILSPREPAAMAKKILLVSASVFLIWQSYVLLVNIGYMEGSSWFWSLFVAWVLNMFVTGIFAFAGFALPTEKLLPAAYYEVRNPHRLRAIYGALGVGAFRKFLLATLWRGRARRKNYYEGTKSGIAHMARQSMKAEFGHLIPFLILCVLSVYLAQLVSMRLGVLALLINLLGNLYPVLLQRHHRMRIQALARRYK